MSRRREDFHNGQMVIICCGILVGKQALCYSNNDPSGIHVIYKSNSYFYSPQDLIPVKELQIKQIQKRILVLEKINSSQDRVIIAKITVWIDPEKVNITLLDRTLPGRGGKEEDSIMEDQIGRAFSNAVSCAPTWALELIESDQVSNYWFEMGW